MRTDRFASVEVANGVASDKDDALPVKGSEVCQHGLLDCRIVDEASCQTYLTERLEHAVLDDRQADIERPFRGRYREGDDCCR